MNEMEALNLALEREQGAQRFYSDAAEKTSSTEGKRMFSWLASEEAGHSRLLEKEIAALQQDGKWLSAEEAESSEEMSEPIQRSELPSESEVKGEVQAQSSELEILEEAVNSEQEAAKFYAEAARATSDPNGKAILERLTKIEEGHQLLLEEEYDWIRKSKKIFPLHRFSLPQK
ncbi:MAG: ferritin family protein [Chloroflexota bacterium]